MADECPSACLSYVCGGAVFTCTGLGRRSISRSLAETLVAAASTMLFLASANSEFAPLVSSTAGNFGRLLKNIKLTLCEPYFAFAYSLVSACITCKARSEQGASKKNVVGIMLNCPIFIEIPAEYHKQLDYKEQASEVPKQVNDALIKHCKASMRAMTEIAAEQDSMDAVVAKKVTKDMEGGASSLEMSFSHQVCEEEVQQSNTSCSPIEKAIKGFKVVSGKYVTACKLSPRAELGGDRPQSQRFYIELHPSPFDAKQVKERMILLRLGLVPEYEQLRFLRSRNTFQAVVTTLQGLDYMLRVVQRLVEHLRVSPLEAILASFNFIIILQYILNVYACVHYQRPLILRLDSHQFNDYCIADRSHSYKFFGSLQETSQPISSKLKLCIGAFLALLSLVAFQSAFVHYALTYMHHCLLCSLSAFIICLLSLSAVILVSLLISNRFRKLYEQVNVHTIIKLYTSLVSISSIALAIAATLKYWHIFNTPQSSWITFILPQATTTSF